MVLVGDTLCEPLVPLLPVHPPLAVQPVALVLLQVRVLDCPDAIEEGLAATVTTGAAGVLEIATVADVLAFPPMPLQLRV